MSLLTLLSLLLRVRKLYPSFPCGHTPHKAHKMNLFYLDKDPQIAGRFHCDKHVGKMLIETCQMLSTAHHELDSSIKEDLYRPTHRNHPSSIWCRHSSEHYQWALELAHTLASEFKRRFGKEHKSAELLPKLAHTPKCANSSFVAPPLAMPVTFHRADPVEAYRAFYTSDKREFASWTKQQNMPDWYAERSNSPHFLIPADSHLQYFYRGEKETNSLFHPKNIWLKVSEFIERTTGEFKFLKTAGSPTFVVHNSELIFQPKIV
jgi:hypothetical protein